MSKRITKILSFVLATAISFGAVLSTAPKVVAEDDQKNSPAIWLQISPVSNHIVIKAGSDTDYSFTVSNIGSETFNYHVYAAPYSVVDEDYNVSFNTENTRTQIARWIKFIGEDNQTHSEAKFTIGPGEKQTIRYRVEVPDDIPAGGQYATIFAESDEVDGDVASSGIKTVSRVGLIVYGRTDGDTVDAADITDYNVPGFMTGGNISVSSRVENKGNTDFEATYDFEVKSIFGKQLYTKSNSYNILPDTARRVSSEWEETPMMGLFQVHYRVAALNGQVVRDETRLVVIMPIFAIILSIILLTLIIIWIIIIIRKRRERKSRLLV
ncbi:hypothetical protein IJH74_02235 [Candidatus Saccharibacteria bacterium]|nr:hypothetical protein [Candidatus Saccharibacteria bacterium]